MATASARPTSAAARDLITSRPLVNTSLRKPSRGRFSTLGSMVSRKRGNFPLAPMPWPVLKGYLKGKASFLPRLPKGRFRFSRAWGGYSSSLLGGIRTYSLCTLRSVYFEPYFQIILSMKQIMTLIREVPKGYFTPSVALVTWDEIMAKVKCARILSSIC